MSFYSRIESGIAGLDRAVDSIRLGDNVVWQTDSIPAYASMALAFARRAAAEGRTVAYVRFARHAPVIPPGEPGVSVHELDASEGFERFAGRVHQIATELGLRAFYVFDCLSDLADAWATDLMIGNFFVATCPYLFDLETVAYFGILRDRHSSETVARVRETTQLFLELYAGGRESYVQPLKVWQRYSPTMFLPHRVEGDGLTPLTGSSEAAPFFALIGEGALRGPAGKLDSWDRRFLRAEDLCRPGADPRERDAMRDELCGRLLCRDERVVDLAKRTFELEDLIAIKRRMIGTGYVGGKTAGMLLARKILEGSLESMETHDSFYVGSDVFYTYLVQNKLWRLRMRQRTKEGYLALSGELREGLSRGAFPDGIKEQFYSALEHFGQSPIIVRSSSLLEDGFGNAFAGKYDSVFRVNQGDPEARYAAFEEAVRAVYASMMGESALSYRLRMGLEGADEQMALLVQRVSGSFRGKYFFPLLAGVADSRNAYPWKPGLDPRAGMLRLVLGLGTRAVDRTGDDWPRLVALDDPAASPWAGREEAISHSQRMVDVLDVEANAERSVPVQEALSLLDDPMREAVSQRDYEGEEYLEAMGRSEGERRWADFGPFLRDSGLCSAMRGALAKLEEAYAYPVDVEFTVNPAPASGFLLNVLQCRPLSVRAASRNAGGSTGIAPVDPGRTILSLEGKTMGGPIERSVRRLLYVSPRAYVALPPQLKAAAARLVGRINASIADRDGEYSVLLVPGRCGSSMPELGLPVGFADICNFGALAELADPAAGLAPELSYGSHFFRDLVEAEIFYMAVSSPASLREELMNGMENRIGEFAEPGPLADAFRLCLPGPGEIVLRSDIATGLTELGFAGNSARTGSPAAGLVSGPRS